MAAALLLAETACQPHASALLSAGMPPEGKPSHAYLFHGPAGSGKRAFASAFAGALLADGARAPADVHKRVDSRAHPDLTWVRRSGAAEMLVADIDGPIVAAASRTPFEARRRVFVIEGADLLNERAANKLLKTLEAPPAFAHLILIAERLQAVMETIVSRCQLVRFVALAPERIERLLRAEAKPDVDPSTFAAAARLCLGDIELARLLCSEQGLLLRAASQALAAAAFDGEATIGATPWSSLLAISSEAGEQASAESAARVRAELDLLAKGERKRREREGAEDGRRAGRRARTEMLDLGLRLLELWLRDALLIASGASEMIYAVDCAPKLKQHASGRSAGALLTGVDLVSETRLSLRQNVSAELALAAMCIELRAILR